MKLNDTINKRLWRITEPVCTGAGYELIDVVLTQSKAGWVLRVFIDHPPSMASDQTAVANESSDIGFQDCERISRELSAVLDVEDPIDHPYNLEVSSPGLDRPLRKAAHFRRHLGETAKVTLHEGVAGRRNFKGTLVALDAGSATGAGEVPTARDEDGAPALERELDDDILETAILTMNVDGTEYLLPFNDIETARLVPDWDSVFQRGRRR